MVREMRDACDKAGLKFGAYISPWDRNNPDYGTPQYIEIYREQLREIYTNYGDLFMSWHDGANGGDGYYGGARESRYIDRSTYYDWEVTWGITRDLQPGACIFSDIGLDVRWIGNESGLAGDTCWATFTPKGIDKESKPAPGASLYGESVMGHREGKYWMPAECDVPLRPGWFYHPEQDTLVKTPAELFDLYCKSAGRGQCLDLGLCPDRRGLIHENDVAVLRELGDLLERAFETDLTRKGIMKPSNTRGQDNQHYGVKNLTDKDRYSYWATDDSVTTPELELEFKRPVDFNIIIIRENIRLGQRIDEFAVDAWKKDAWHEVARASSIGALRIIRLPEAETSAKIRLRIIRSSASPCISELGVYSFSVQ
jgi:alpha-L-fucosidase